MKICEEKLPLMIYPKDYMGKISAQEDGFRQGWKAALEWALSNGWPSDYQPSLESIIESELKSD